MTVRIHSRRSSVYMLQAVTGQTKNIAYLYTPCNQNQGEHLQPCTQQQQYQYQYYLQGCEKWYRSIVITLMSGRDKHTVHMCMSQYCLPKQTSLKVVYSLHMYIVCVRIYITSIFLVNKLLLLLLWCILTVNITSDFLC